MARLIRTEREVEGRVEESWILVEEDALDQWPEGPLATVGRPATRVDGMERARGEARYTADVRLPGMLHAAVLRSPHAYAHAGRVNLDRALAAPGVRAAIGPGEAPGVEREAGYFGAPVAAVAADTEAQARAAHEVVEAEYRTATLLHNALETHQAVCEWEGDRLTIYVSTQFIWGVRDEVADGLAIPRDKVRVVCRFMGGGFGAKNHPGDYTFIAAVLARRA